MEPEQPSAPGACRANGGIAEQKHGMKALNTLCHKRPQQLSNAIHLQYKAVSTPPVSAS